MIVGDRYENECGNIVEAISTASVIVIKNDWHPNDVGFVSKDWTHGRLIKNSWTYMGISRNLVT